MPSSPDRTWLLSALRVISDEVAVDGSEGGSAVRRCWSSLAGCRRAWWGSKPVHQRIIGAASCRRARPHGVADAAELCETLSQFVEHSLSNKLRDAPFVSHPCRGLRGQQHI
jgi:hypothetical protein